jgi:hypothetical protein
VVRFEESSTFRIAEQYFERGGGRCERMTGNTEVSRKVVQTKMLELPTVSTSNQSPDFEGRWAGTSLAEA